MSVNHARDKAGCSLLIAGLTQLTGIPFEAAKPEPAFNAVTVLGVFLQKVLGVTGADAEFVLRIRRGKVSEITARNERTGELVVDQSFRPDGTLIEETA